MLLLAANERAEYGRLSNNSRRHDCVKTTTKTSTEWLRPDNTVTNPLSVSHQASVTTGEQNGYGQTRFYATLFYAALHRFAPLYLASSFTRVAGMPH